MKTPLDNAALDQLFREARTFRGFIDQPVPEALLHQLYDLLKFGPTDGNACPARFVFVRTPEAKARLAPALDEDNVPKMMAAGATVIVAYDEAFHDQLPKLVLHRDARADFVGKPEKIQRTATYSSTLQTAYLILAARALGLDAGPMGGFDRQKVDELFLSGTAWRASLLVNLGYGDPASIHPRAPRLDFATACQIV